MRRLAVFVCLLLPAAAVAQSTNELAVFSAGNLTPVGGLPPIMTSSISGRVQHTVQFGMRYGYVAQEPRAEELPRGEVDVNNFGVTAVLPMGLGATVSITGGVSSPTCSDCDPGLMLSLGGDMRLTEVPFGVTEDAWRLTIAVNGEFGYGKPKL